MAETELTYFAYTQTVLTKIKLLLIGYTMCATDTLKLDLYWLQDTITFSKYILNDVCCCHLLHVLNQLTSSADFGIQTNNVDPDQTAPMVAL